jgi:predicted transcriptional regulator
MTALELNTIKLEFVKEFLEEEDEDLVNKLMTFFRNAKYTTEEAIPGLPRTVEELKASIARAEEEYEKGLAIPHDEVFKEYEQWM